MASQPFNYMDFYLKAVGRTGSKQNQVAQTAEQKKAAVQARAMPAPPTPDEIMQRAYQEAAAEAAGVGPSREDQSISDIVRNPNKVLEQMGRNRYYGDDASYRTDQEAFDDTIRSAIYAPIQTVGNIGAAGLGILNDDAGAWASRGMSDLSQAMDGVKSQGTRGQARALQSRIRAREEENARVAREEGDDTLSTLKRIGKDFLGSIKETIDSPVGLSEGTGQAIGSLFAGGALGKGLAVATGSRLGMKTAIGAMEGSGAFTDTTNRVLEMPLEELEANSEYFREEVNGKGRDPEEVRNEIANQAGLAALAIQAPVAAVVGKLRAGREAQLLTRNSLPSSSRQFMTDVFSEALEEGLQSATGTLAGNVGVGMAANPDQDLVEGVGGAVGQGALFGAMSVGVTQGPGMAARGGLKAVSAVGKRMAERAERQQTANEAASSISPDNLERANQELVDTGSAIEAETESAINASSAPEEVKQAGVEAVRRLFSKARFDPAPYLEDESLHPAIRENLADVKGLYTAVDRMVNLIDTAENDEQVGLAANALLKIIRGNEATLKEDFIEVFSALDEDHELVPMMRRIEGTLTAFHTNERVQAALKKAEDSFVNTANNSGAATDQSIVPTENEVLAAVEVAKLSPDRLDPGLSDNLLFHHGEGNIQLTPEQLIRIQGVSNVAQASRAGKLRAGVLGLELTDIVSSEVLDGSDISVMSHMKTVVDALEEGDTEGATKALTALRDFAQHMQNKVDGMNRSIAAGTNQLFEGRNKKTGVWYKTAKAFNPNFTSEASIHTAQQIALEAGVVGNAANSLVQMLPELGVKPVDMVAVDPVLDQPVADVLSLYNPNRDKPKQANTQPEAKPEAEVSEPAEAKSETAPLTITQYVDRYIAGEGRDDPEMQQFAANNGQEIEAEFQRRAAEAETPVAEDPAQPEGGDTSTETEAKNIGDMSIDEIKAERKSLTDRGLSSLDKAERERFKALTQALLAQDNQVEESYVDPNDTSDIAPAEMTDDQLNRTAESLRLQGESEGLSGADRDRYHAVRDEISARRATEEAKENKNKEQAAETERQDEKEAEQVQPKADVETAPAESDPAAGIASDSEQSAVGRDSRPTGRQRLTQKIKGLIDWFAKSFTIQPDRTRFREDKAPFDFIREVLEDTKRFIGMAGGNGKRMTDALAIEYQGYLGLADQVMAKVEERLDTQLDQIKFGSKPKGNEKDTRKSLRELVLSGDASVLSTPRAKALHIAEVDEDGKITYDRDLMQKAVLAGLQWALNAGDRTSPLDAEDIANLTGLTEEEAGAYLYKFEGMAPVDAVSSLTSMIMRFWGVSQNKDAPIGYSQGIVEAVAKEVLKAMSTTQIFKGSDQTLVKEVRDLGKILGVEFPNTINRWVPTSFMIKGKGKNDEAVPHPIKSYPTAIEDLVMINPEQTTFIGEPPVGVPKTQLRNKIPLAIQQRKTIAVAQKQAHLPNVRMINLYKGLGQKGIVGLFAEGDITNQPLNKNDRASKDGKNRTFSAAFDKLMATVSEIESVGDLESTPVFYRYEVSRANRLQMQGEHNPQASKLAREAILPTWDVLNLTGNPEHLTNFYLALAQALGVKIHNQSEQASIKEVIKILNGVPETIEILSGDVSKLGDNAVATIRAELGGGNAVTPVAVHAVMEYARFKKATTEEKAAFRTALYIEADGVTNGPVNAMHMLTSGYFTPGQIENYKKGGAFWDGTETTNQYGSTEEGKQDLYRTVSNVLGRRMTSILKSTNANSGKNKQLQHLMKLMQLLDMKMEVNSKGEIEIDRSLSKNPLTITVYGSGARGIAGNITQEILEVLYSKFSDALSDENVSEHMLMFGEKANGDEQLALKMANEVKEAIDALTSFKVDRKGNVKKTFRKGAPKRGNQGLLDMTYDRTDFASIQDNVLNLLVEPLQEIIETTLGGTTLENAKTVRQATQLMSVHLAARYQDAVRALIKKKQESDPSFKLSDMVSRAELEEILEKLLETIPYIKGTDQNIFVSKTKQISYSFLNDSANSKYVWLSDSLDEQFPTDMSERAPANAGVGGIPLLVIGMGDAHMIQLILTDKNAPKDGLPVFDGFHMKLSTARKDAEVINRAARQVWQNNPMQMVLDTYNEFKKNNDPMDLFKEGFGEDYLETARIFFGPQAVLDENGNLRTSKGPEGLIIDDAKVWSEFRKMERRLENGAREVDARQKIMAKYRMATDQMAGMGVPFIQDGIDLSGKTSAQIAEIFNAEYAALTGGDIPAYYDQDTDTAPEENPLKPAKDEAEYNPNRGEEKLSTLMRFGRTVGNVKVYSQRALKMLLANGNLSAAQMNVMSAMLKTFDASGYQILVGSKEDVSRMIGGTAEEIAERVAKWGNARGHMNSTEKYIAVFEKGTPETMIHEIIHAATFEAILAYYNGTSKDVALGNTVRQLEELMEQFLALDISEESDAIKQIHPQVADIIQGFLNKQDPWSKAAALNEFMAYVLANRKLGDLTQRTKVTPMMRFTQKALKLIRQLIFHGKKMPEVKDDLFSNLLFRSAVVANLQVDLGLSQADLMINNGLSQEDLSNRNAHLSRITDQINQMVGRYVQDVPASEGPRAAVAEETRRSREAQTALLNAENISEAFVKSKFRMNVQERSTFEVMVGALGTAMQFNSAAIGRIQEYYSHIEKTLKVEDLMRDPDKNDPNDRAIAQSKLNTLLGDGQFGQDSQGRSYLMAAFIALATTNKEFREVLRKVKPPKGERDSSGTLDAKIENSALAALEGLSLFLSGEGRNSPDALTALDRLRDKILQAGKSRLDFIDGVTVPAGNLSDAMNERLTGWLTLLGSKGKQGGEKLAQSNNRYVRTLGQVTDYTASLLNRDTSDQALEDLQTLADRSANMPNFVRSLIGEVIGRTKSNANVYDMIKLVRGTVQKIRQQFRTGVPKLIESKFSTPLNDVQKTAMFRGMAKTDIAALRSIGFDLGQIVKLLSDSTENAAQIKKFEDQIRKADPAHANLILKKSMELARHMMFREVPTNLLRNAYTVANLANESGVSPNRRSASQGLIKSVDSLVSMYALDMLNKTERDALTSLAQSEPEGVRFALSYLSELREYDNKRSENSAAFMNSYKGHITSTPESGGHLVVESMDSKNHARLLGMSYKFIKPYGGSSVDVKSGKNLGYYYLPASARAAVNQGIMQTVRPTAGGVDLINGFSEGLTAGWIVGPVSVASINRALYRERGNEKLMPIFNDALEVVAFERSMDPAELSRLEESTDLPAMLGVWKGRQIEEGFSTDMNGQLIERLKEMYDADIAKDPENRKNYVDLFAPTDDAVINDMMRLMTPVMREQVETVFGKKFYVSRSMVDQVIGYRNASVGDFWTGVSRWSPETQKNIRNLAIGVFGNEAYRRLTKVEGIVETLVAEAKRIIVVQSIAVPIANFTSTMLQLVTRGVPIKQIMAGVPKKVTEINDYVRTSQRLMEAEAELGAVERNPTLSRALNKEIESIKDFHRRLSIWPLIAAGEFNSISDVGVVREDLLLSKGKLSEYIESLVDRLPDNAKTLARYGLIARDTPLFKGLQRSIEYGDFIGKAIRYDDLMRRGRKTSKEALGEITEEYVNYDYLPGRNRGKLEDIGLMWFWAYKLRSMKIGLSILRDNPFHTLVGWLAPVPELGGDVGLPFTDNAAAVIAGGDAGWSLGWEMGIRSPLLHPTINVLT